MGKLKSAVTAADRVIDSRAPVVEIHPLMVQETAFREALEVATIVSDFSQRTTAKRQYWQQRRRELLETIGSFGQGAQ